MDGYLLHLVPRDDDQNLIELDVTLCVGGATVSGHLITEDRYFELMARKFESVQSREQLAAFVDEEIRKQKEAGEDYGSPQGEAEFRELAINAGFETVSDRFVRRYDRSGDAGKFIHLRDVEFRLSGFGGGVKTDLWRGRLDAIEGFMVGS